MGAYNFTKERKKIYKLHAEGKFFRDIAKECKISSDCQANRRKCAKGGTRKNKGTGCS
ncbi:MAG: hypothetical protein US10_C0045G0005 [Candidatus Moranbacteria bacterium GW2011_GWD2_36_198]|nr:MAG: hypothetical protein US10_C0045G0005 [Candidatus Moranbacteria bacterium GW2011_GWD2_36_198]